MVADWARAKRTGQRLYRHATVAAVTIRVRRVANRVQDKRRNCVRTECDDDTNRRIDERAFCFFNSLLFPARRHPHPTGVYKENKKYNADETQDHRDDRSNRRQHTLRPKPRRTRDRFRGVLCKRNRRQRQKPNPKHQESANAFHNSNVKSCMDNIVSRFTSEQMVLCGETPHHTSQ